MIDQTICDYLSYDPDTGVFTWKVNYYRHKTGNVAGHVKKGYWALKWKNTHVSAHRLAFYFMTGSLPSAPVDHINGDTLDNRWKNLRIVTPAINAQNRKKLESASGTTGVVLHKKSQKWQAQIGVGGETIYLGLFQNVRDAHLAYAAAKKRFHDPLSVRNLQVLE